MAGTIIVSSIKTDTDNSFIVRSNTGATLFSVDTTSISIPDGSITSAMIANGTVIAADILDGTITDAKIAAVANTKITGLITSGQIATVANTQITGNITQAQIATGVAGTGPSFSASSSSTSSISHSTNTKIPFATEDWDTNSNYDPVTNYRFTPTVAGYYQVNIKIQIDNTGSGGETYTALYKNGSIYKRVGMIPNIAGTGRSPVGSVVVYLNGSTDYIEAYVFQNTGGSVALSGTSDFAYFQASMVRSA